MLWWCCRLTPIVLIVFQDDADRCGGCALLSLADPGPGVSCRSSLSVSVASRVLAVHRQEDHLLAGKLPGI